MMPLSLVICLPLELMNLYMLMLGRLLLNMFAIETRLI